MNKVLHFLKLVSYIQNPGTSYRECIEFVFKETPPADHNFLKNLDLSLVETIRKTEAYDKVLSIKDNPNKNATIGFFVQYLFHYHLYKNIAKYLPESEFIVDIGYIKFESAGRWYETVARLIGFLREEGVSFRVLYDYSDAEFFKKYQTFVCHNYILPLSLEQTKGKKKVRVQYGNSKDLYNFGAWLRYFDLALTYGKYSDEAVKNFTDSEITGNARFDDWFSGKINERSIESIRKKLNPNKKTVLYLPTHGELSFLESILPALPELSERFNVIIKTHYITEAIETDRLEKFKSAVSADGPSVIWEDDTTDLLYLLLVADVVVSDNSGAIFDALLVDKPMVLLDNLPEDFFENQTLKERTPHTFEVPLTYKKSIEQLVKKERRFQVGEVAKKTEDIVSAVDSALKNPSRFQENRQRIREILFSYCDGSAGARSAEAIRNVAERPPRKQTLSGLSFTVEREYLNKRWGKINSELSAVVRDYVDISPYVDSHKGEDQILFSIIIPVYNGARRILGTLASLSSQEAIDLDRVEILIIDDVSTDETESVVQKFIEDNDRRKVLYCRLSTNRGPAYARNIGIMLSRGTYICFTDDDVTVPSRWLANFYEIFTANKEIAGAGGWYTPESYKTADFFSRYLFWRRLPHVLESSKSAKFLETNQCGNTANVCYRKSVLIKMGGFNIYFRFPTNEDWELKMRLNAANFSLYSTALTVTHRKKLSLSRFVKDYLHRGWSYLLISLLHPDSLRYRYRGVNSFFLILGDLHPALVSVRGRTTLFFTEKISFCFAILIKDFCLVIGKYTTAYKITKVKT